MGTTVSSDRDASVLTVEQDARRFKAGGSLYFLPADRRRDVYISDISLRRLGTWLDTVAARGPAVAQKVCIGGFMHRRLKPGIPIAAIQVVDGQENTGRSSLELLRSAYLLRAWSTRAFIYRIAFKDLRDKASAAARAGRIADFELLLETVTEIAIRYYDLAEALIGRGVFTPDELSLHFEPRATLRAVVHELGEEVLASRSPNVIKAWIHHPHSAMERTRYHPTRSEPVPMYSWFRAVNLIRDSADDSEGVRALVFESLRRRLLTYGQDLANAFRIQQGVLSEGVWTFEREAEWYLRVVGKLLSAISEDERAYTIAEVSEVLQAFPNSEQRLGAIWIECARHLADDFLNPDPGSGVSITTIELERSMSDIRTRFPDLWMLLSSWRLLALTPESREQTIARLYQQAVDMSWDEQIEFGAAGVLKLVIEPYRGKLGIALLALELATTSETRCLREDDALLLFDIVDREPEQISDLKKLARLLGCGIDIPTAASTIMAAILQYYIAQRATGDPVGFGLFIEPDAFQRLISEHRPCSGAKSLMHELELLIKGANHVRATAPFHISAANHDAVKRAGLH